MSYVLLFLQLALILAVATVFGRLAIRLRIPAVAGELVAGVVLGPTILGRVVPGLDALLPGPAEIAAERTAFVRVGLLFFLFLAGLEVNVGAVRSRSRAIFSTSFFGLVIPFAIGAMLVLVWPGLWSARTVEAPHLLPLVIGTALAISALPVIARILMDLGLMKSEVGIIVMAAAAVDDIVGWSVFAAILGVANAAHGGLHPAVSVGLVLLSFAVALTFGRGLWQRILDRASPPDGDPLRAVGIIAVAILVAGAAAEGMGIHAALGAFLIGVLSADREHATWRGPLRAIGLGLFAPLYFGSVGLSLDVFANFDVVLVLVVLVVACLGKLIGVTLGARLGGVPPHTSLAIAFGMNARGAVGILLASLARETRLIDEATFVALVVMALVTSVISGPGIRWALKRGSAEPATPSTT